MKRILLFLMLVAAFTTVTAQTVRDRHNATMGKVERDGTVRDRSNSSIGKVESNGTVRDRSNSYLGKVESDGTVRDRNNSTIGRVEGVSQRDAAVIFFFDFFGS